jgi:hypothetical protein
MAVTLQINGGNKTNIVSYSVTEDSTPTDINDSSGGSSQINLSLSTGPDSDLYINDTIRIIDDGLNGFIDGTVNGVTIDQNVTSLTADSLIKKLVANIEVGFFAGSLADAISYYMTAANIASNKYSIDPGITGNVIFQSYSGDLWTHLKQICALYAIDVSTIGDTIRFRPARQVSISLDKNISKSVSISNNQLAQSVEVYYYNNRYLTNCQVYPDVLSTSTDIEPSVVWVYVPGRGYVQTSNAFRTYNADALIMSVDADGYAEYEIELNANVSSLPTTQKYGGDTPYYNAGTYYTGGYSDPYNMSLPNNGILLEPVDSNTTYSLTLGGSKLSYYAIAGKDGVEVTRNYWLQNGGRVECYVTSNGSKLKFKLYGPKDDALLGPFRLAFTAGDEKIYPYVKIKATSLVAFSKNLVTIPTGVTPSKSIQEVGATIDSTLISSIDQAYRVGVVAAGNFSLPSNKVSVSTKSVSDADSVATFPYGQIMGNIGGARFQDGYNFYRVRTATVNESSTTYDAERDTLFSDFQNVWNGKTYTDFSTQFTGKTFEEFGVRPLWVM